MPLVFELDRQVDECFETGNSTFMFETPASWVLPNDNLAETDRPSACLSDSRDLNQGMGCPKPIRHF
jgi:hypothetical protein